MTATDEDVNATCSDLRELVERDGQASTKVWKPWCQLFGEPETGSDVANLATQAVQTEVRAA